MDVADLVDMLGLREGVEVKVAGLPKMIEGGLQAL
jgi:hypothetical protein